MKVDLRAWGKNAALMAASVVVAGVLVEIGLWIAGVDYDASLYTADRTMGWAYRPGAEGWTVKEGRAYVAMNSAGMRDREHTIDKPGGTIRIAVLGDSFSGAVELDQEKAYWRVVETKLAGCAAVAPKKVEVLNFGVGGYGTAQELLMLRSRVWQYQPDIVLLQVYFGNDIFNNHRVMNDKYAGEVKVSPYFVFEGDELVLDDSFLASPTVDPDTIASTNLANEVINASRLFLLLSTARRASVRPRVTVVPDATEIDPGPLERNLFLAPRTDQLKEAWRVTEGLLSLMHDEVAAKGAKLYVTTISHPVQLHPDKAAQARFMKKIGVTDLFYPDDRVKAYGEARGMAVISLARPMAAWADAHPDVVLHGFPNAMMGQGHWNEDGHRLAGELIAERLCGDAAPPSP